MKRWMIIAFSLILLLSQPGLIRADHTEGVETSANAAILMDQDSGRVLFDKNPHEKRKIASITKIMTAVLAMESGKWEENVEVSQKAAGVEGSSLFLKPGEHITLQDLTTGLMLRSGNDAAVAIAEHVGGSMDGFIYMMNEKAEEIGMENSHFTNPHGLDDGDRHYSTAYDMALLMQYAMKNETFRKTTALEKYKAPQEGEKWDRIWQNKNKLLTSLYEYSTGGKTGYTKSAGRTLVSTAEKENMGLIAVTLDAPSDWEDHISMFNWGFSTFDRIQLAEARETIPQQEEKKGDLFIPQDFYYPLMEEEINNVSRSITLDKHYQKNPSGISAAGEIKWTLDNHTIQRMPVMLDKEQEDKTSWFGRVGKFLRLFIGGE
ncbi:D-alanyl-D-alanine carboxypeptidase family protein [Salibacterium aidingense]|uniref:D-alanyl-D-alanine carboxypeptidase family protein n=1 Tax=Salibacterium aidingense TaxID=384933 RepID=UPI003BD44793